MGFVQCRALAHLPSLCALAFALHYLTSRLRCVLACGTGSVSWYGLAHTFYGSRTSNRHYTFYGFHTLAYRSRLTDRSGHGILPFDRQHGRYQCVRGPEGYALYWNHTRHGNTVTPLLLGITIWSVYCWSSGCFTICLSTTQLTFRS